VLVTQAGFDNLRKFEYELSALLRQMQARGIKLDVEYTEKLRESLLVEQSDAMVTAARYGVANINSTSQVAEALEGMGESLRERTAGGKPKVDKAVLLPLADLDRNWNRIGARTPNPLADAVLHGKRAGKWAETYAQAFLDLKDEDDRVHPWINGLQARTARMSVSRPPLQQLPANDSTIRRAFVADDRHTMLAVDYSQIEMRVLAAIANDETMINAIKTGVDLHDFTAERLFGENFTDKQRKVAKGVGFGKVYGGGVATLTRQTGADADSVKKAIAAYDDTFPGVKRLSNALIRSAEFGRKEVRTPSGRVLPLDRDRLYAATNYIVQSTARDVMAQAMLDMAKAGLDRFMLLPIHDEVLAQAPSRDAEDVLREMKKVMEERPFMGVPLVADGEIVGANWGEAYE
jgi:DNA polymerase-1